MSEQKNSRQPQLGTYVTMFVGLLFLFLVVSQAGKYHKSGFIVEKAEERLALARERQKAMMRIGAEPVSANYTGERDTMIVLRPGSDNPLETTNVQRQPEESATARQTQQLSQSPLGNTPGRTPVVSPERQDRMTVSQQNYYLIRPNETLYGIAQRVYGDGNRWRDIVRANPELTNPNILRAGQRLLIPQPETPNESFRRWAAQNAQEQQNAGQM